MRLIIVSNKIYDFEKRSFSTGGYQTYMRDLAALGVKLGLDTEIVQPDVVDAESAFCGYRIRSVKVDGTLFRSKNQTLFDRIDRRGARVVIGTDQMNIRARYADVYTVQHGIAFDGPWPDRGGVFRNIWRTYGALVKVLVSLRNFARQSYSGNIVCVDYNYYNWFRTIGTVRTDQNIQVVPNYANQIYSIDEIHKKLNACNKPRKIVFARRFVDYRGCELFIDCIRELLPKYEDLRVVFAGDGPLEPKVRALAAECSRITVERYDPSGAVEFLHQFDISVIPTLSSEGTSLSLLESMAAGCYPIATHVGGITNVILDGYNGSMIYPAKAQLLEALDSVLNMDGDCFRQRVNNAYLTISSSFSKERWERDWTRILSR